MPHPEHLERYEQLYPGAAKMIFDEFQAQGQHRRELEAAVVAGSERRAYRGQIIAALLIIIGIVAGVVVALSGEATGGAAIAAAALGSGALAYWVGGRPHKSEGTK